MVHIFPVIAYRTYRTVDLSTTYVCVHLHTHIMCESVNADMQSDRQLPGDQQLLVGLDWGLDRGLELLQWKNPLPRSISVLFTLFGCATVDIMIKE